MMSSKRKQRWGTFGVLCAACLAGSLGCATTTTTRTRNYYSDVPVVKTTGPDGQEVKRDYEMVSPGEMVAPGEMVPPGDRDRDRP